MTVPAIRVLREDWADAEVAVALRLTDGDGPDLDTVATALTRPERPLFIGRKTHAPAEPIYRGPIDADDAHAALDRLREVI